MTPKTKATSAAPETISGKIKELKGNPDLEKGVHEVLEIKSSCKAKLADLCVRVETQISDIQKSIDALRDNNPENDPPKELRVEVLNSMNEVVKNDPKKLANLAEKLGIDLEELKKGGDFNKEVLKEKKPAKAPAAVPKKAPEKPKEIRVAKKAPDRYICTHVEDYKRLVLEDIAIVEKEYAKAQKTPPKAPKKGKDLAGWGSFIDKLNPVSSDSEVLHRLKNTFKDVDFSNPGPELFGTLRAKAKAGEGFEKVEINDERSLDLLKTIPDGEIDKDGNLKEEAQKYADLVKLGYKGTYEEYQDKQPRSPLGKLIYQIGKIFKNIWKWIANMEGADAILDFFGAKDMKEKLQKWRKGKNERKPSNEEIVLQKKIEAKIKQEKIDKYTKTKPWISKWEGINIKSFYQKESGKAEASIDKRADVLKTKSPEEIEAFLEALLNAGDGTVLGKVKKKGLKLKTVEMLWSVSKDKNTAVVRIKNGKFQIKDKEKKGEFERDWNTYDLNTLKETELAQKIERAQKKDYTVLSLDKDKIHNLRISLEDSSEGSKNINEVLDNLTERDVSELSEEENKMAELLSNEKVRHFLSEIQKNDEIAGEIGYERWQSKNLSLSFLEEITKLDGNITIEYNESGDSEVDINSDIWFGSGDLKVQINGQWIDFDTFGQLEAILKDPDKYFKKSEQPTK